MRVLKLALLPALAACAALPCLTAQSAPASAADASAAAQPEETVALSPFTVSTDKDKGYQATNTTAGTRLNTPIKELPMPIEVITDAFLQDTASTDLRQALRYSAGIQIQTQNDWGAAAGYASATPGRINNPEGETATADQSHVKIRGFVTDAMLREGFRRQNSTDLINVARIEVIRGPSALLYGVGNFGGVVNYLVKQPEWTPAQEVAVEFGSSDFKRTTLDVTGPLSGTVAYRLTSAYQDTKDNTDFFRENHFFVSPVVSWRPWAGTQVTLDTEYGKQNRKGIGFQDLRAVPNGFVNDSAGYNGGFLAIPGRDPKNFRWSGPDTYNNSEAYNFLVKLDQKITDQLHFAIGYNSSAFRYDQLDVGAAIQNPGSNVPAWAIASIQYVPLQIGEQGIDVTALHPSTIGYQWTNAAEHDRHDQVRADLTYDWKIQPEARWLRMDHTFLAGLDYTNETHENQSRGTPYDRNMYKSPADFSPFRFGRQADGTPDYQMLDMFHIRDITQDAASYAVYQGKLLDGWVTLIAGIRKDRSWNKDWHYNPQWGFGQASQNQGADTSPVARYGAPSRDTTHQYGIDVRLNRSGSLSVYAMSAEASQPNYSGIKDFNGNLLQSSLGKDKEAGLKFDLFNGRISGTVSKFEITRTRVGIGNAGGIWWAPTYTGKSGFNPGKDIVYQINDLNPNDGGAAISYMGLADTQIVSAWNAGVAAGKIYQATNSAGATNWYVNAGTGSGAGATYLDTVFSQVVAEHGTGWWGWIYNFDNLTNETTVDYNGQSPPGPTGGQSVPLGSDRSRGWDAQILVSPTDNLQVLLTWSHIEKVVLNAAAWIKYPYPQDRWAIWYAPIDWADGGTPASARYTNPADTSTHISFGNGLALDDTPKNEFNAWVNYQLPKKSLLHGLVFGVGCNYEGSGSIYPTYFSQPLGADGKPLVLNTRSKMLYSAMLRYEFKLSRHDASIQLNVDNLANNTDYYGLIPQPPRTWYLTFGYKL